MKKLLFSIYIQFSCPPIKMESDIGSVEIIPFAGEARGEFFNGTVAPGGVDVQTVNQVQMRHLDARYLLIGKDSSGTDTKIYVENEAWIPDVGRRLPFRTVPRFMTDNSRLASYLHQDRFEGSVEKENQQLVIRIYDRQGEL